MSLKATLGATGRRFLLVGAGLRWHIGEYRRPVEKLVVAAPGDESSTGGDAVVNYCVNPVSPWWRRPTRRLPTPFPRCVRLGRGRTLRGRADPAKRSRTWLATVGSPGGSTPREPRTAEERPTDRSCRPARPANTASRRGSELWPKDHNPTSSPASTSSPAGVSPGPTPSSRRTRSAARSGECASSSSASGRRRSRSAESQWASRCRRRSQALRSGVRPAGARSETSRETRQLQLPICTPPEPTTTGPLRWVSGNSRLDVGKISPIGSRTASELSSAMTSPPANRRYSAVGNRPSTATGRSGPLIRSRTRAGPAAATWAGSSTRAIVYVTSTVNSSWFCSVLVT